MQTQQLSQIAQPLLSWYGANARVLPWRESPLPYNVWVSEIMLQQTRVEAVKPYYDRFMRVLPDVWALAKAEPDRLLKLWEGLGYYNRVRNLQRAAKEIVEKYGGEFPSSYQNIIALPGIGKYTAAAICSIAFGQPYVVVDGNVCRVAARLMACEDDIAKEGTRDAFRTALQAAMPEERAGDFNQALMELGAMVCLPNGAPRCGECPVSQHCLAYAQDNPAAYPVKAPKKARKIEERMVFLLFHPRGDRVALRRRPRTGLLASMWEFPGAAAQELDEPAAARQLSEWEVGTAAPPRACGRAVHIFTHREWHMAGFEATLTDAKLPDGWVWADRGLLADEIALPSAFRTYTALAKERISNQ